MRSIKEIFVVGHGPSSSHTMGPAFACEYILEKYKDDIDSIKVTLYGSLALTGKGHLTDYIISQKIGDIPHEILFNTDKAFPHPNTLTFAVMKKDGEVVEETIASIGGGTIVIDDRVIGDFPEVYPHRNLMDIVTYCKEKKTNLVDYVKQYEDKDIISYLGNIYDKIEESRNNGIQKTGELPGNLHVQRKARQMYLNMRKTRGGKNNIYMNVSVSSFAVAEENASGGIIVIAPTCGSAGVLPGAITFLKMQNYSRKDIIDGLCVAGLIGIIAKTNASISGAECGCQAEIGVASSMGAALIAAARRMDNRKIAQCAEVALEHSLGLTCDPVKGYVQIPCIERCAMYALKAKNAFTLSRLIPSEYGKISFDDSVQTMLSTGKDIPSGYKETSREGLSKLFK